MRTLAVSGIILLLLALGWSERGFGEPILAPRGELRIVDKHPQNWVWIVHNVLERLSTSIRTGSWCRAWPPVGAGSATAP
jgi:hypothetical protein